MVRHFDVIEFLALQPQTWLWGDGDCNSSIGITSGHQWFLHRTDRWLFLWTQILPSYIVMIQCLTFRCLKSSQIYTGFSSPKKCISIFSWSRMGVQTFQSTHPTLSPRPPFQFGQGCEYSDKGHDGSGIRIWSQEVWENGKSSFGAFCSVECLGIWEHIFSSRKEGLETIILQNDDD